MKISMRYTNFNDNYCSMREEMMLLSLLSLSEDFVSGLLGRVLFKGLDFFSGPKQRQTKSKVSHMNNMIWWYDIILGIKIPRLDLVVAPTYHLIIFSFYIFSTMCLYALWCSFLLTFRIKCKEEPFCQQSSSTPQSLHFYSCTSYHGSVIYLSSIYVLVQLIHEDPFWQLVSLYEMLTMMMMKFLYSSILFRIAPPLNGYIIRTKNVWMNRQTSRRREMIMMINDWIYYAATKEWKWNERLVWSACPCMKLSSLLMLNVYKKSWKITAIGSIETFLVEPGHKRIHHIIILL